MTIDKIKNVGIVGAGTMGQGIAQVCALAGFEVQLNDVREEYISKAIHSLEKNLEGLVAKGKLTSEAEQQALARIKKQPLLNQLKAELIIEAAIEKLEAKLEIFKTLESVNDDSCVIATNTSSIPVTQLASLFKSPGRFAGLHFFNPASVMKLVEIVSGAGTSSETIATLIGFSKKLGKEPVLVKDSPGFIVNRVARHYYTEALKLLEENVADFITIDELMKNSGFKMGPFELMDLIGVDTNLSVTTSIYNAFHQKARFRPSRIQQQKVDAGQHGRKSGKGFYTYPE